MTIYREAHREAEKGNRRVSEMVLGALCRCAPFAHTMRCTIYCCLCAAVQQYQEIVDNPDGHCTVHPTDDYFNWQLTVNGPAGTPYENRSFDIHITFPADYPVSRLRHRHTRCIHADTAIR